MGQYERLRKVTRFRKKIGKLTYVEIRISLKTRENHKVASFPLKKTGKKHQILRFSTGNAKTTSSHPSLGTADHTMQTYHFA
jgi:hypothetical protein